MAVVADRAVKRSRVGLSIDRMRRCDIRGYALILNREGCEQAILKIMQVDHVLIGRYEV
jgi:hypothetical protein